MKELSLEKMNQVEGGSAAGCAVGIAGAVIGFMAWNPVIGVIGVGIALEEC